MLIRSLWIAGLVTGLLLPSWGGQLGAAPLRAFEAHYRLVPTAFKNQRYIDAHGEIGLRLVETCAAWEFRRREMLTLVRPGALEEDRIDRLVVSDPKGVDGPARFAHARHAGDGTVTRAEGEIRVGPGGAFQVVPRAGPTRALAAGTVHPMGLWRAVVERLGRGPATFTLGIFDPAGGPAAVRAEVAVAPAMDLIDPLVARLIQDVEAALRTAAAERPHTVTALPPGDLWPVTLTDPSGTAPARMRVHEIGVPLVILLEREDMSLQADLMALSTPPSPICPDGAAR